MPYFTVLTKVGQALIATAHATGTPVKLTHLAVGDGEGAQITPREDMSALRREVWRGALNTLSEDPQNSGWVMAEAVVPETAGGFTIREVGLFDETGKLVAVGSLPDSYKPQLAEGSAKTFYIRMRIEIGNASSVTLLIDPSVVLATKEFVAIEVGKVRVDLDGHIADLANPHQVTAAQAGAEPLGAVADHDTSDTAHADIRALIAGLANVPPGTVVYVAKSTAPAGYLKCNGAAVSRTTYAALYAAIGTTFGAGNGSTTFGLPDLRGEFIRALDDGRGVDSGRVLGSAQADELRSHCHTIQWGYAGSTVGGGAVYNTASGIAGTSTIGGVETRPRNIALLAVIKY